jgi:hypothetical protein
MYRRQPIPQVSQALAAPSPTGGLNDLDPLSAMGPEFCIDMMNLFPDNGLLLCRQGYREWVSGITDNVRTIMEYNSSDGVTQKFAACDDGIFDITNQSENPAEVANCTDGYFEQTNFATVAGQYLVIANGIDAPMFYDGTTWASFSESATPTAPGQISGIDPAKFSYVLVHKNRLWFLERNSMTAWFLPVDAMGGTATPFFLGGVFRRGGKLLMANRWSADTGEGLDDRLVFFTNIGEVATYAGNDPSQTDDWRLDSIYYLAAPLSSRSVAEYGGDLIILTRRGLIPLSTLMSGSASEVLYSNTLTKRISRTLMRLTLAAASPFPPELVVHSEYGWILINIYDPDSAKPIQLCMNFLTGAWGKFNYPILTCRSINQEFYFGMYNGTVQLVTSLNYVDGADQIGLNGTSIECYAFSAYTYLGDPTANKHAKLFRPVFQTEVSPSFKVRILPDFRLDSFDGAPVAAKATSNAKWDSALWDAANWAGIENVYRPWVSANVLGYAFAWQIRISTSSAIGIAAVEWVWESGGLV